MEEVNLKLRSIGGRNSLIGERMLWHCFFALRMRISVEHRLRRMARIRMALPHGGAKQKFRAETASHGYCFYWQRMFGKEGISGGG